jgi:hypothetical protein
MAQGIWNSFQGLEVWIDLWKNTRINKRDPKNSEKNFQSSKYGIAWGNLKKFKIEERSLWNLEIIYEQEIRHEGPWKKFTGFKMLWKTWKKIWER